MPFKIGNVVKLADGYIVIITESERLSREGNYKYQNWISFSHPNVSGSTRTNSYEEKLSCYRGRESIILCDDETCPHCGGQGSFVEQKPGLDKATLLAPSANDYFLQKINKAFGIER